MVGVCVSHKNGHSGRYQQVYIQELCVPEIASRLEGQMKVTPIKGT